jgi:hypothetical protein
MATPERQMPTQFSFVGRSLKMVNPISTLSATILMLLIPKIIELTVVLLLSILICASARIKKYIDPKFKRPSGIPIIHDFSFSISFAAEWLNGKINRPTTKANPNDDAVKIGVRLLVKKFSCEYFTMESIMPSPTKIESGSIRACFDCAPFPFLYTAIKTAAMAKRIPLSLIIESESLGSIQMEYVIGIITDIFAATVVIEIPAFIVDVPISQNIPIKRTPRNAAM